MPASLLNIYHLLPCCIQPPRWNNVNCTPTTLYFLNHFKLNKYSEEKGVSARPVSKGVDYSIHIFWQDPVYIFPFNMQQSQTWQPVLTHCVSQIRFEPPGWAERPLCTTTCCWDHCINLNCIGKMWNHWQYIIGPEQFVYLWGWEITTWQLRFLKK